jgi:beta-amylase
MVDIWWGVVERLGPKVYDWSPYKQLLQLVKSAGLKMTACFSFHACGANVGDVYEIPLPSWVLESALQDPDVLFTDQHGYRNPECLSLFADDAPVLAGRSPLQCYGDFMRAFAREFGDELGSTVTEASIGCGPCGELRYPAYPENKRCPAASQWRFPGIGEFQCYDKRALLSLAQAASEAGHLEWGGAGPHDAGGYNDLPHDTGFFRSHNGSWDSPYGQFFLGWYSGQLVDHGERVLKTALDALDARQRGLQLSLKCAGVHWWYMTRSHAAELTAGYCNHRRGEHVPERNGYYPIIQMCARLGVALNFTCVEMRDVEHPWDARCGPEGLLRQVRETAAALGVPVMGENALCRFDRDAYDRVVANCLGDARPDPGSGKLVTPAGGTPAMASFTFLRLTPALFDEHNFPSFVAFVRRLRDATGQDGGSRAAAQQQQHAPSWAVDDRARMDTSSADQQQQPRPELELVGSNKSESITFRF